MPSKDKDVVSLDDRPREKRRHKSDKKEKSKSKDGKEKHRDRDKDREKDRDKVKEKEKEDEKDRRSDMESSLSSIRHLKSSRSSRPKPTDSETHSPSHHHRRHKTKGTKERERLREDLADQAASDVAPDDAPDAVPVSSAPVPDLTRSRISSATTDRISLPYPSFSKAHSREYVQSKEDVTLRPGGGTDPLTPEPTDIGSGEMRRTKSADSPVARKTSSTRRESRNGARPPTPPDTDLSAKKREGKREGTPGERGSADAEPRQTTEQREQSPRSRASRSRVSKASSRATSATSVQTPAPQPPSLGDGESTVTDGTEKPRPSPPRSPAADFSPESAPDSSSPETPTQTAHFPPPPPSFSHDPFAHDKYRRRRSGPPSSGVPTPSQTPASDLAGPHPPRPPPPPPLNIQETPQVDYLMQHGGLAHAVPKNFLAVLPRQNGTRPSNPPLRGAETLFAPFFHLLDQYQSVLASNGSVAVATGHRTVARRLLDRLENVFSRDLPLDGCACIMCEHSGEPRRGLGWGEVLERVSGRIDLPAWPPFDLASLALKATGDAAAADQTDRPPSPVNVDPDVAEEFREHYIKQSKRVRVAVGRWMSGVADTPAPSPQDIDDHETLAFAILTSLDPEDRPYFNALLLGSRELQPAMRAPTPLRKPRSEFVLRCGLALQRLYRLPQAPRDAETAVYLVKNPDAHDLLRTIADINPSEWEILTSGRFDGFLWSGADNNITTADDDLTTPTAETPVLFPPSRPGTSAGVARHAFASSRTTTPVGGPYSRGATPASFVSAASSTASSSYPGGGRHRRHHHAVSNDEETEVAAVAEVEREIFAGMEALEDAFEKLHRRAEAVRTSLRQRGAGLQMSLQSRRVAGGPGSGGGLGGIDVLPSSGGSLAYERPAWGDEDSAASESEWGGDDVELAPDDSASNISSSRHRRPKRRNERRTPAPIEEEDE